MFRALRPLLHVHDSSLAIVAWVRCGADNPVGISGGRRDFAAFALEADIPVPLRRGALAALGGQLDSPRDIFALREQGGDFLLELNCMGRYVLSAAFFGGKRSKSVQGPTFSASCSGWAFPKKTSVGQWRPFV